MFSYGIVIFSCLVPKQLMHATGIKLVICHLGIETIERLARLDHLAMFGR